MTAANSTAGSAAPASATDAVLVASEPVPEGTREVRGVDFEQFHGRDITVAEMVENMTCMGFQGSAVAEAARIINDMVTSLLEQYPRCPPGMLTAESHTHLR